VSGRIEIPVRVQIGDPDNPWFQIGTIHEPGGLADLFEHAAKLLRNPPQRWVTGVE
jgi:hypothetical protein